jgi:opacity protein-like surface antigen
MVYGTGGYARTELKFNGNLTCTAPTCAGTLSGPASLSTSRSGWVAGGGVEFKPFAAPWIAGLEYLYYRFDGTTNVTGAWSVSPFVVNYSVGSFNLQTVRFRLSYKLCEGIRC